MTAPDLRIVSPARASDWTEAHIKALAETDVRMAMDMVTRKYRDRLFYHAVGITKDWEEAYDVVQEVFIRAMRETRLFQPEFRIKAWLFRVTSNLCFNLVRDRKRRGAILETFPQPDRAKPDQVERVFKGERREEVLEAIDQMTRDHKEILLLRYYDDLSYAEIAAVLDVKLGTVMSRLSRARGRLLAVLGEAEHLRK
jgi:RNA polymerase sigma-70 factor (ECF subfamily)